MTAAKFFSVTSLSLVLFSCLFGCEKRHSSSADTTATSAARQDSVTHTWPGFGIASNRQEDSVEADFARQQHLTHTFGDFFKTPNGKWVVVHYIFGIPEGAQNIFTITDCPPLDSATFRENGRHYWQDRNGIYYAALDGYSPQIITVSQADPPTFQYLGFEHLAIDSHHVYQGGRMIAGLLPATLKVYTPGEQFTEGWDFTSDAYLISGDVGYRYAYDEQRLPTNKVRHFRPPAGYKLAYPLSHPKPARPNSMPAKSR